jgi:hypothetical protein
LLDMAKKEEKENNVAFVGEAPWKPLVEVQTAYGSVKLPQDQSKPFYHPEAALLIRTFPHLYKPVKAKGEK